MREIKLTRGKVAIVDDEDYERLAAFKWHAYPSPSTFYAKRSTPKIEGPQKTIYMAREVMRTERFVDHRDGNGLNNQKYNLRPTTCEQRAEYVESEKKFQLNNWI